MASKIGFIQCELLVTDDISDLARVEAYVVGQAVAKTWRNVGYIMIGGTDRGEKASKYLNSSNYVIAGYYTMGSTVGSFSSVLRQISLLSY